MTVIPIRGENIGSAYVRIFGDGSSMPRDVREALDSAEPSVRQAGAEQGSAYEEEFRKSYRASYKKHWGKTQSDIFTDIDKSMVAGFAKLKLADNFFKSDQWGEFRSRLVNEFGDAGDLAGKRLEERFRDSADLTGLAARMRSIGPEIRRAQADLLREMAADEQKARLDMDREFEVSIADRRRLIEGMRESYEGYVHQLGLVAAGERGAGLGRGRLVSGLDELARKAKGAGIELSDLGEDFDLVTRRAHTLTPGLSRLNVTLGNTSDRVGTFFGRGARNDFLNFVGSLMRNVTRLVFLLPRLAESAVGLGRGFSFAFRDAGGGLSGLIAGVGTLGPLLATAAAGAAAFGVALAVASLTLGPLVALVSGLVGALTAMVSTVAFGAVGALGALAGTLLPLAAGISVTALAINGLSEAMRDRLARQFGPVRDGFEDLQRIASRNLFADIGGEARQLGNVLEGLGPLTAGVARAIRNVFSGWADDLDSPAFRSFINQMGRFLPDAVERLGRIFSNVGGGISGIFVGLIPITRRFLGWLEDITANFERWANTRQGREDVRNFMDRAATSAKALGDFIDAASGLLGELLDKGQGSGDTIFKSMTDNLREFTSYLRDNPEALQDWFEHAKDIAQALEDAAIAAGELMDELDSPENRELIEDIVNLLEKFLELLAGAEGLVNSGLLLPLNKVFEVLSNISDFDMPKLNLGIEGPRVGGLVANFAGLGPRLAKAMGKVNVRDIVTGDNVAVNRLVGVFAPVPRMILRTIGKVNVREIITGQSTAVNRLVTPFNPVAGMILRAISKVNVREIITGQNQAVNSMVTPFNPVAGMVLRAIGKVNVSGIVSGAGDAVDALVGMFRGLASRIVDAIGTIVPRISMPSLGGLIGRLTASGGVFLGAQTRIIGEAGPEAVVPLRRPLSQVDPAVRALSAVAQGLPTPSAGGSGKTVNVEQRIYSPQADPRAVAIEAINHLVAVGY